MEDAATAEISRAQVWQWIRHGVRLEGGDLVTKVRVKSLIRQEAAMLVWVASEKGADPGRLGDASALFERLSIADEFEEFLTLPAYEKLLALGE